MKENNAKIIEKLIDSCSVYATAVARTRKTDEDAKVARADSLNSKKLTS
jgi:hypothetical protein